MVGEGEAIELLAEVLHHVVPLRFAMDQHVEPERLLASDDVGDLSFQEGLILRRRQRATIGSLAVLANLGGLGEGTDGRRRQERQIQPLPCSSARAE